MALLAFTSGVIIGVLLQVYFPSTVGLDKMDKSVASNDNDDGATIRDN